MQQRIENKNFNVESETDIAQYIISDRLKFLLSVLYSLFLLLCEAPKEIGLNMSITGSYKAKFFFNL